MKKYTVAIAVRNEEKNLGECLDSVLVQTLKPNEILICVNGSTDRSKEIAEEYAKKYRYIKVLESKPGKTHALNKMIETSINNDMVFVDGDIVINREAAEKLLSLLDPKNDIYAVAGGQRHTLAKGNIFRRVFWYRTTKPTEYPWIIGTLFCFSRDDVIRKAKSKGIKVYPDSLLADDYLITQMLIDRNTDGSVKRYYASTKDAYATAHPISSFRDYRNALNRIVKSAEQMKNEFADVGDGFDNDESVVFRTMDYLKMLKEIDGIKEKVLALFVWSWKFILLRPIEIYEKKKAQKEYKEEGINFEKSWIPNTSTRRSYSEDSL